MGYLVAVILCLCCLAATKKHVHGHDEGKDCVNDKSATKVFITGISGMIGSHVARYLLNGNHEHCYKVYGLIRPRTDTSALNSVLHEITFLYGDLTDHVKMNEVVAEANPEYVFHFAAQAINGISFTLPHLTFSSNIQGTLNLFEAIRNANIKPRVLVAGSSTEYGQSTETATGAIREDLHLKPISPYGISKVATENIANLYFVSYQIPTITARLFIHVGIGGTDFLAIQQFCRQIAMGELGLGPTTIFHGDLSTARDMTDCKDSAAVLVKLIRQGEPGEAYNIGSGTTMTIKDLLDTAVSMAKVKMVTQLDESRLRSFDEKVLVADNSKIVALTGWTPNTNMTSSVYSILNYWRHKLAPVRDSHLDL